jgi:hypothetical protein
MENLQSATRSNPYRFITSLCKPKHLFGVSFLLPLFFATVVKSQELFVFTEPASTLPAKSISIRLTNWLIRDTLTNQTDYHLMPEIIWGITKNLELNFQGFFSNRSRPFSLEGGSIYSQYRFFSKDGLNQHFRMAAFARLSSNNGNVFHEEIEINGHNSGYELGIIATRLLHKYALSATSGFEHAFDNGRGNRLPSTYGRNAISYTLSMGHLLLPKEYQNYKQVNVNGMVEFLGQTLLLTHRSLLDLAPSAQFIFNSQTRIDIGYKKQLYSQTRRIASDGLLIRLQHTFFN